MKTHFSLIFASTLLASAACKAAIVEPIVTFLGSTAQATPSAYYAQYFIDFTVFASGGDVYINKRSTAYEFFDPQSGNIFDYTGNHIDEIRNRGVIVLNAEFTKRQSVNPGGDTGNLLRIPAGQTATFRWDASFQANPDADAIDVGNVYTGVKLKYLNWSQTSGLSDNFLALGPEFQTERVLVAGIPEPNVILTLVGAGAVLAMRRIRP